MTAKFKALVLSYKTAPLSVRERVSLNEQAARQLLKFLNEYIRSTDLLVVSTCNRTEIYYTAEQDLSKEIFKGLELIKSLAKGYEKHFAFYEGLNAVQHLFEVAIGLDAQVVGDRQISGQVKNAYQWSADENVAGPFLHRLMHTIFFANKRVAQQTSFRDGATSISYAAKELAGDLTQGIKNPKALVIGVGEIGQDVCLNLANSRFKDVIILNRTVEKAEKLASKTGFKFSAIENLVEEIQKADVIIGSVSGNKPLINRELINKITFHSHKFFIDLSIPRSVEPSIEDVAGAIVYNLDDIEEKTTEAVEKRKAAVPHVQAIIQEAIAEFEDWSKEMKVSPTIQKLKNAMEQIRKEELMRYLKNSNSEEVAKLEEMSRSLTQKILKYPVLQLKAACKRGNAEPLTEMLQEVFDLERVKK